jgi:hypothetical protein
MKYTIGDWLGVGCPDGNFLVVYVAAVRGPQYDLALTDYISAVAPAAGDLEDRLLLAVGYETEDSSFTGLDVVIMGEGFVDGSDKIWLIRQQEMPDYIGLNGLERMVDIGGLAAHFKRAIALRREPQPERDTAGPVFVKKYLVSVDDVFWGAPPANPFPAVKLYRAEGEVVLSWQIYGSVEPAMLVVNEEYQVSGVTVKELKEEYEALIREKRAEGYKELYKLLPDGD